MRHFERTHRVPVAWLKEIYEKNSFIRLIYANTDQMIADIYTKQFTDVPKFNFLRTAVGIAASVQQIKDIAASLQVSEVGE